jgi:hypothetical protein
MLVEQEKVIWNTTGRVSIPPRTVSSWFFKEVVTGSTRAWFLEHKLCVPHRRFKALVEGIEPKVEPSDDHLRKNFPKYMDECMVRIGKRRGGGGGGVNVIGVELLTPMSYWI